MKSGEAADITKSTRITIGVVVAVFTLGLGTVLYINDMRTEIKINAVQITNVAAAQETLKNDLKETLREIREELKTLNKKVK